MRDELIDFIDHCYNNKGMDITETVDLLLLTLPSGLIAKKECSNYLNHVKIAGSDLWHTTAELCGESTHDRCIRKVVCCHCNGTGFITRKLTIQEATEIPKLLLTKKACVVYQGPFNSSTYIYIYATKERIEVEER